MCKVLSYAQSPERGLFVRQTVLVGVPQYWKFVTVLFIFTRQDHSGGYLRVATPYYTSMRIQAPHTADKLIKRQLRR